MKSIRQFWILNTCLILSFTAISQQTKVKDIKDQYWFQYYATIHLKDKWLINSDVGYRLKNGLRQQVGYITRLSGGYKIQDDINVHLGFAHSGKFVNDKLSELEYRPFQDLNLKQEFTKLDMGHRLRLEERFFQTLGEDSMEFAMRIRYRILTKVLLFENKRKNYKFTLDIGDEIHLVASKGVQYNVFNQNRFMVGPSSILKNKLRIFLYGTYIFNLGYDNKANNTLMIWLGVSSTFKKKENKGQIIFVE